MMIGCVVVVVMFDDGPLFDGQASVSPPSRNALAKKYHIRHMTYTIKFHKGNYKFTSIT